MSDQASTAGSAKGKGKAGKKSLKTVIKKKDGVTVSFSTEKIVGNGSFGVVYAARIAETGEKVAIKKVLQDERFKNRELQIMRQLRHPNIVEMKHCFYSNGDKPYEVYLNLVLEYVPETVYSIVKYYSRRGEVMPMLFVKLYMYQICRSLAYLHSTGICHRDIKPHNLLVDPASHVCKLCDFGSAKRLTKGEPSVAYICSRYYRAPELIFGAQDYTSAIDIWSSGCVFGEMLNGVPMFPGKDAVQQLVEILRVLGTPTPEEVLAMNKTYTEHHFPHVPPQPWRKLFRSRVPDSAIDLLSQMLKYVPSERISPLEACAHPFFDELREPHTKLPNGKPLPPLFDFTDTELSQNPKLYEKLVPPHLRDKVAPPSLKTEKVSAGGGGGSSRVVLPKLNTRGGSMKSIDTQG